MAADRLGTILELIAKREGTEPHAATLCAVAAAITESDGAAIVLVSPGPQYTGLSATDAVAQRLLELELTLGEGPCIDACSSETVVGDDSLHSPEPSRWLAYSSLVRESGAHAVFAFPLRTGTYRIGALCLYRDAPGELTSAQSADGYLVASVVSRAVLSMQAGAPDGTLATTLEDESTFAFVVHQAAGMVAVQGAMSVGDALVALRSHAFSSETRLLDLAQRVVAGTAYFDPTSYQWINRNLS